LLATGAPFETREQERRVCWRVHPFLWLLRDVSEPRLDHENDGFTWARFEELRDHATVPRLPDAFEAMCPPLPRELTEGERFLREDRAHGARELGGRMLGILSDSLGLLHTWPQWVLGVMRLGASRPAMAPLSELSRRLLENTGPVLPPQEPAPWAAPLSGRDRVEAAEALDSLRGELDRAAAHASRVGASFLQGRGSVATFSSSSTVREAFRLAAASGNGPRKIVLSPAHPSDEGLAQAEALRGIGYEVELVEDEQLAERVARCELLLLGADAVLPDGAIANRAGSAALAAQARRAGVPVVALADEFKRQPRPELFAAEELSGPNGPQPLFEMVDASLIDRLLGLGPG
jgi:hypothetical protein